MFASPAARKPTGPHQSVADDRARAKAARAAAAQDDHNPPVANLGPLLDLAGAAKRLF